MGKRSMAVTSSRSEFLSGEGNNCDPQYERHSGCFVTTRKAMILVILAISLFIILALLMYYYGPNSKAKEMISEKSDIEKLINKSIENIVPDRLQLPTNVYPTFYKLRIQPYLEEEEPEKNFTFHGKVTIGIQCTERTKTIVLNAANIIIKDSDVAIYTNEIFIKSLSQVKNDSTNFTQEVTTVPDIPTTSEVYSDEVNSTTTISPSLETSEATTLATSTEIKTVKTTTSSPIKETQYIPSLPVYSKGQSVKIPIEHVDNSPITTKLIINTGHFLEVDKNYTLEISFSGNISDNLIGLYKAPYVDLSGKQRWVINTNFKPVYARSVFPCFDEPSLKSTFEISVARKENLKVLSNMPLKETESKSEEGWVWDHFEKTPKMTTYSVAFLVGDFHDRKIDNDVDFKIWAVDNLHESNFSADMSLKALKFLEDFYGMKYPLPKLDFVVVPDLAEEAEESWGLLSFRYESLLVDPKSENWEIKSNILKNLAEQLSHQWFGKLVTMSNWSDFWLREGIAKFLSFAVANSVDREMGMLDTFVIENLPVLYADSLKTTKRLYHKIDNFGQVSQIYNSLILNKGAALLRMLNFTLTGPVFKNVTQNFIKKWAYNSTTEEEYWKSFDAVALNEKLLPENLTVTTFMESWTMHAGYPVVTVKRNYTSGHVLLNQQRFVEGNGKSDNVWIIPLSYITQLNSTIRRFWLTETSKEVNLELNNFNNSWIIFNADAGFYRVNYDNENWMKLLKQINTDPLKIPSSCRAQILSDAFELAYKGSIKYEIPLGFTSYLEKHERQVAPWEAAMKSIRNIVYIVRRTMFYGKLQAYLRKIIKTPFEELGFEEQVNESLNKKILRKHIIETACFVRYQKCLLWAQKMFHEWTKVPEPDKNNPIPYTFRKVVMCYAIKMGGEKEWEFVWQRTLSTKTTPADLRIMYLSLGCSRDSWIIRRYLHKSLNGSIALQDVPHVWRSITHPVGIDVGLQFIRENWQDIYNAYDQVYGVFNSIINEFFGKLSTKSDLEDLTMIYKDHESKLGKISPSMLNVVERIKTRIAWSNINLETVVTWLVNNA